MILKNILTTGFLVSVFCALAIASTVPPNHAVYSYLRRMQIKYDLSHLYLNSLPLHRDEIRSALMDLTDFTENFTAWELAELKKYRYEFFTNLRKENSYLVYKKDEREIAGQGQYYTSVFYRDSLPNEQIYAFGTLAAMVDGQVNDHIQFISEVTLGQERVLEDRFSEHYDAQRGLPINTPGKAGSGRALFDLGTFDGFRTVLTAAGEGLYLDFAHDWNQWGPGAWQHPSLSQNGFLWVQDSLADSDSAIAYTGNQYLGQYRRGYTRPGESAPLPQLRAVFSWNFLKYTKFFGRRTGLSHDSVSYLTGHRLEGRWKNLTVGLYEILTYSRDRLEWSYAMPLVSLFIAEHLLGDNDNVALGVDIDYILMNRARAYVEIFLDDLVSPFSLFDNFYGNKYAATLGIEVLDLLLPNASVQVEYSRVEPWVYGHHAPVGFPNNQLQHFGNLLGSTLPPNSHAFRFRWLQYLPGNIDLSFGYSLVQRSPYGKGSSLLKTHQPVDGDTKEFLGGVEDTRHSLEIGGIYRWHRHAEVSTIMGYETAENWRGFLGEDLNSLRLGMSWLLRY